MHRRPCRQAKILSDRFMTSGKQGGHHHHGRAPVGKAIDEPMDFADGADVDGQGKPGNG
jgi:hypothetical protein